MRFPLLRLICLAVIALGLLSGPAAAEDKAGWPTQLRFMAGPPGGNWFALGTALSEMWTKDVLQTTNSTGGGVSNIINANLKKGDLGFTVNSFIGAAVNGEEDFSGRKVENAVVFANLYTQVTYFVVRKDFATKHGITSVDDLIAKNIPVRFATLKPGTASEFLVKVLFSKGYNTNFAKLKKDHAWSVEYASYEGGADLLADSHLDCFAFSVGPVASIVMNIESRVPVEVLPVSQQALDAVSAAYGTTTYVIPTGVYTCVTQPTKTIGDFTSIVVRKDLPESLVFALNKALWQHKDAMVHAVKDMQELSPAMAVPTGVPVHPGSVKFWQSVKKL
ncbi:MAG: TAXI family TRAP transporter solute-binding subunit [Desulfovibrionaceae bacterium]